MAAEKALPPRCRVHDLGQFPFTASFREERGKQTRTHPFRLTKACAMGQADILAKVIGKFSQVEGGCRANVLSKIANIASKTFEECL